MGIINCCDVKYDKDAEERFSLTNENLFKDKEESQADAGSNSHINKTKAVAKVNHRPIITPTPEEEHTITEKPPEDFIEFIRQNEGSLMAYEDFDSKINIAILNTMKINESIDYPNDHPMQSNSNNQDQQQMNKTFTYDPIYFKNNNYAYKGQWKSTKGTNSKYLYVLHGKGSLLSTEQGLLIEGLFIEGALSFGRVYALDGSFYEGDIVKYQAEGQGRFVDPMGINYISRWSNSIKNGKGSIIFPNGTKYSGRFDNDRFTDSAGTIHWTDYQYLGNITNYIIEGQGILDTPNGQYDGSFVNNTMNGNGKFMYKNGMKLDAEFKNGTPIGGVFTFPTNQTMECMFKNGKIHGDLTFKEEIYEFRFGVLEEISEEIDPLLAKYLGFFENDETFVKDYIEKNALAHFFTNPIVVSKEIIMTSLGSTVCSMSSIFKEILMEFSSVIE